MAKKSYENWGDVIFWVYANLNMLMATMSLNKEQYDRQSYMIRAKAYKSYRNGSWKIHSLFENNNWKVEWGKEECWYCNRPIAECGKLSVDHIFPKALGGDDSFDNIAYACRSCNSSKGTKDFVEWSIMETGYFPSLRLICIYMKLVYKYSEEHNLMELHNEDLDKLNLPFNPQSAFYILDCVQNWFTPEEQEASILGLVSQTILLWALRHRRRAFVNQA